MNFTREPIIETIISPKEGYNLLIRNTKGGSSEYSVDAVEVVNFGNALFFRSMERPKAFLLPISDFEVVEMKETRVAIKNAQVEKSVKIASKKSADEGKAEETDKKKKRSRRRRTAEDKPKTLTPPSEEGKGGDTSDEAQAAASSPRPSALFAPPASLISEQFGERQKSIRSSEEDISETVAGESVASGHQEEPPVDPAKVEEAEAAISNDALFESDPDISEPENVKMPTPDDVDEQ